MSKEVLEKALKRTNELEEKAMKQLKVAETLGKILGYATASALDATVVWAVAVFLVGLPLTWLNCLGITLLVQMLQIKFK